MTRPMTGWMRLHLVLVFVSTIAVGWSMPPHDRFAFLIGAVLVAVFVVLAPSDAERTDR